MKMLQEFKTFALKGNVLDLAIGIIIGAAFGKVVNSLVNDLMTPVLGILTGSVDFADKAVTLRAAVENAPAVVLKYGLFINTLIEFLIIGLATFLVVKQVNFWKRTPPPPEPTTRECPLCYCVISKKATRCSFCTSTISTA
jgi:large conductance mechanosensitive channel